MYIELHFIQSFAPSNLNRDDTNSPKDCEFGGHRRLRVSSQCFKRAIRHDPALVAATQVPNGFRTKYLAEKCLLPKLGDKPEDEARPVALRFAEEYGMGLDRESGKTSVLLYLSESETNAIAKALREGWEDYLNSARQLDVAEKIEDKKAREKAVKEARAPWGALVKALVKDTKGRTSAPDIALFGRMLADKTELNIDAACQVAHALSTHAVRKMELDYYTAVDDLKPVDTSGAGMVGTQFFSSACFYRYMRLNWAQLNENLKDTDLACRTVQGFLRAAEAAIPTGKQNSHAAHSRPSFMLGVARAEKSPGWSLINAFERPVRPRNESGLIGESVKALDMCWNDLRTFYGPSSVKTCAVALRADSGLTPNDLSKSLSEAVQPNFEAWVEAMLGALPVGAVG